MYNVYISLVYIYNESWLHSIEKIDNFISFFLKPIHCCIITHDIVHVPECGELSDTR